MIFLDEAENAANMQNMRTLYNIIKMLSNEKPKQSAGICILDENERLITSSAEQQERWTQHFCEVLNREVPDNAVDVI
jgi:hypothetical protein